MIDTDRFNQVYIDFLDALEEFDKHKGIKTGRAVRRLIIEMVNMLKSWRKETFYVNSENKKRLAEMKERRRKISRESTEASADSEDIR